MKIGIAGIPAFCTNYAEALLSAAAFLQKKEIQIEISLLPQKAAAWDALILPGGGDLDPVLLPDDESLSSYTQKRHPSCRNIDPACDRQQLLLLDWFVHDQKPVLGICKGLQLINLYFGGGLCQELPTAAGHRCLQYDQIHPTHAHPDFFLAQLYGTDFAVNSAHHQGISFFAKQLTAIQWADDGVIEGLVHNSLPIIGLQWHPERLCGKFARPDAVDGSLVFQYFLNYSG